MMHFLHSLDYPGKNERLIRAADTLLVSSARHLIYKGVIM